MLAICALFALAAPACSSSIQSNPAVEPARPASPPTESAAKPGAQVAPASPTPPVASPTDDPVLAELRASLDAARKARASKDYTVARSGIVAAIEQALAVLVEREDAAATELLGEMGKFAQESGELPAAESARRRVLEVRTRTLPDEDRQLQRARLSLALTLKSRGNLAEARALEEKVLEIWSRTLPGDHADLQAIRGNLALTIKALGDLKGAHALEVQVHEIRSRTQPDDHPDLQAARANLSTTLQILGDLHGARALQEKVLEVNLRTLSDDDPSVQLARGNLANTLKKLGDLRSARALEEKVLEVRLQTLPEDHPYLQAARTNLGDTLRRLGDLERARALQEQAFEVYSRTLREDHPDLGKARNNLAIVLQQMGDLLGARALLEKQLEVCSRTLPDDNREVLLARINLATTIKELGDLQGARALDEGVLEVFSRTLPDDHPDLQSLRHNLAAVLQDLGDLEGSRALKEKVLEVQSRTLADDDFDLAHARQGLAIALKFTGEYARARELEEKVLEVRSRTLHDDHKDLQIVRGNLAVTLRLLGDFQGARALNEKVLESRSRTLPDEHPHLQASRGNLAIVIAAESAVSRGSEGAGEREKARERCAHLLMDVCRTQVGAVRTVLLSSPRREAEERCARIAHEINRVLSFAGGYGVFERSPELERAAFALSESARGAALASAGLARKGARAPGYAELRDALDQASEELAAQARSGATSAAFDAARVKRETAEQVLIARAREVAGEELAAVDLDLAQLPERLGERTALVCFRRYLEGHLVIDEGTPPDSTGDPTRVVTTESLGAFVVRGGAAANTSDEDAGRMTFVHVGSIAPIEAAVREWREGLDVATGRGLAVPASSDSDAHDPQRAGDRLRRLVVDPLLAAIGACERVVIVPDDLLHLVAFDALPLEAEGPALLGDRWRIETRATVGELWGDDAADSDERSLLAVGDVDYTGGETAPSGSVEVAAALRGGAWGGGFDALPATGAEARGIAGAMTEAFGTDAKATLLERGEASRARVFELAPSARFLHVATHGWFASESIRSWNDPEPIDAKHELGLRQTVEQQVKGMSPMLLCGLALAGANLPENAVGRAPGLVTAEELSGIDLTRCELAVLSACETNVGEARAGQGVASLQRALQMAGARSVITSLWAVPDEPTKELMLDFYRRLWVEKKPKWQALWEAKTKIRNEKDEAGRPKYSTRDWAAWVLTGDPN